MRIKQNKTLILFLFFAVGTFAQTTFSSDASDTRNQAAFESNAPLEDIVGVSNKLTSNISINLNDISNTPKGNVKVELAAMKTGIDLRDQHLRSANWLNTEKYPYAEFELTEILGADSKSLSDIKPVKATAKGKLSIHGVTKEITAPVELTYYKETEQTKARIAGNLLKVTTGFTIKLSDYKISIPSMVKGKVDENIKVSVNFIASDSKGGK